MRDHASMDVAAVPLLREKLEAAPVLFALAVAPVVFVGKRVPLRTHLATGDCS